MYTGPAHSGDPSNIMNLMFVFHFWIHFLTIVDPIWRTLFVALLLLLCDAIPAAVVEDAAVAAAVAVAVASVAGIAHAASDGGHGESDETRS